VTGLGSVAAVHEPFQWVAFEMALRGDFRGWTLAQVKGEDWLASFLDSAWRLTASAHSL
jgi:hypothetical protein